MKHFVGDTKKINREVKDIKSELYSQKCLISVDIHEFFQLHSPADKIYEFDVLISLGVTVRQLLECKTAIWTFFNQFSRIDFTRKYVSLIHFNMHEM
jgi:hypothetical protein